MKINISDVRPFNHSSIKAFFTLELVDIGMKIKDCKVILTKNGQDFFIGFPSKKEENGSFTNLIFLEREKKESQELHQDILKGILAELEKKTAS
jgi:DNA-binding cell septation regulator SpoVG